MIIWERGSLAAMEVCWHFHIRLLLMQKIECFFNPNMVFSRKSYVETSTRMQR